MKPQPPVMSQFIGGRGPFLEPAQRGVRSVPYDEASSIPRVSGLSPRPYRSVPAGLVDDVAQRLATAEASQVVEEYLQCPFVVTR